MMNTSRDRAVQKNLCGLPDDMCTSCRDRCHTQQPLTQGKYQRRYAYTHGIKHRSIMRLQISQSADGFISCSFVVMLKSHVHDHKILQLVQTTNEPNLLITSSTASFVRVYMRYFFFQK